MPRFGEKCVVQLILALHQSEYLSIYLCLQNEYPSTIFDEYIYIQAFVMHNFLTKTLFYAYPMEKRHNKEEVLLYSLRKL